MVAHAIPEHRHAAELKLFPRLVDLRSRELNWWRDQIRSLYPAGARHVCKVEGITRAFAQYWDHWDI